MDEEKPQSWWKTLPGIMTAVTAFLTAITGLIVALHQTGMFSGVQEPSPKTTPTLAAPGLISPENRALLPQPYMGNWRFTWDEATNPQEVQQYHVIVSHEVSATPLVDIMTEKNSYTKEWARCVYMHLSSTPLVNWKWKVRVQDKQGRWSPWSEERSFGVAAFNPQLYAEKCPEIAAKLEHKPGEPGTQEQPPPIAGAKTPLTPPQKEVGKRLPGDDIVSIKPVGQDDCRIYFDVNYFINPAHSNDVWVYGWLSYQGKAVRNKQENCPKGGGGMMKVPHLGQGTARLSMGIPEDGKSDNVDIFLRENTERIIAKKFSFEFTARDVKGKTGTYTTADFKGHWLNKNPEPSITRAVIQQRLDKLVVHMWGKCHPTDCDWGTAEATASSANQGFIHLTWNHGFAISRQELRIRDDRSLEVITKTDFTDKSGRPSYESVDYFERE